MAWLLRDDEVLAALEVAGTRAARRRGLIGRAAFDAALLIPKARSVHSFGMRFSIDVAFLDSDLVVLRTCSLVPNRLSAVVLRSRWVLEAPAGAFASWDLRVGDELGVRGTDPAAGAGVELSG